MPGERHFFGSNAAEPLELAFEDELTGLPNRRLLTRVLRDEWAELARHCTPLSVIMIDLDGFKQVNDRYGHATGDRVLQAAAAVLRNRFRSADWVVRYGGDEFAVVLPRLDVGDAESLAARVRTEFDLQVFDTLQGERVALPLSFSFGAAAYPVDGGTGAQLLSTADQRLYDSKRTRSMARGSRATQTLGGRLHVGSIAVLPLRNLSRDPAQEYFAEGMTEELIVALARLGHLRVVSRTSVIRYQADPQPIPVIASDLGVDAVIEGSVLRVGERVRISIHLIDGISDEHRWAVSLDRDASEILDLQREVAQRAAEHFQTARVPVISDPALTLAAVSVPVYEAYLKGRFHWNRLTVESLRRAIDCFADALRLDARHGPSLAGLADCYIALQFLGGSAIELAPLARSSAMQAVQCAPMLAAAQSALATVRFFYDWNWTAAESAFAQALALDSRAPGAHQGLAYLYSALGRHDEAIAAIRRARDLDPLGLSVNVDLGWRYYFARQYPQALRQLKLTLELDPDFGNAHWCLGCVLHQLGQPADALEHLRRAVSLSTGSAQPLSSLGYVLAQNGLRSDALRVLDDLNRLAATTPVSPWVAAVIRSGLGDIDGSVTALRGARSIGTPALVWINTHPEFDPLRGDAGFQALVDELRFPARGAADQIASG